MSPLGLCRDWSVVLELVDVKCPLELCRDWSVVLELVDVKCPP